MCGRYTLETDPRFAARELGWQAELESDPSHPQFSPRFNIAPTQSAPVLARISNNKARISWMKWGLVPRWAKDDSQAARLINARIETASEKPSFKEAWRKSRCVVFCNGYYEWRRVGKSLKAPYMFRLKNGKPMAFAGLSERWLDPQTNQTVETFSILTTEPNPLAAKVHNRMPVILDADSTQAWLNSVGDERIDETWSASYPEDKMESFAVSRQVNRIQAEGPELIRPVSESSIQQESLGNQLELGL